MKRKYRKFTSDYKTKEPAYLKVGFEKIKTIYRNDCKIITYERER